MIVNPITISLYDRGEWIYIRPISYKKQTRLNGPAGTRKYH